MTGRTSARTRQLVSGLIGVALLASGCSIRDTIASPQCSGSSSLLIAVQSVPSAQLVPCFDRFPTGWETETVDITNEGTVIVFDSDRAGLGAARFTFTDSCDVGDAVPAPAEYAGASRFELVLEVTPGFRAKRHYRFDGGCVTWDFDFDNGTPSAMSVELGNALQLVDRELVNEDVHRNFIDEDL